MTAVNHIVSNALIAMVIVRPSIYARNCLLTAPVKAIDSESPSPETEACPIPSNRVVDSELSWA